MNKMESVQEQLKEIKKRFFLMMNGITSRSMRDKGLEYKINWGVEVPKLKVMASEYGKNYDLAVALWKEDIRECKILAVMMMPPEKMEADLIQLWIEQMPSQEIAELSALYLFQHVGDVSEHAFVWIASGIAVRQICGYCVLARRFMRGEEPNERDINELVDQSLAVLQGDEVSVKHSVMTCLQRLAELGAAHEKIVDSALRSVNML